MQLISKAHINNSKHILHFMNKTKTNYNITELFEVYKAYITQSTLIIRLVFKQTDFFIFLLITILLLHIFHRIPNNHKIIT